jgi:hypothetical protein
MKVQPIECEGAVASRNLTLLFTAQGEEDAELLNANMARL